MRSYYAFQVNALYPASGQKTGYYPNINFSDVYFNEPSTESDQNRVMGIIRTGETSGYYIDIFRSKTKAGHADYHDYFYHNLGQQLQFTTSNNQPLVFKPSSKLNSKSGNIKAYDYLFDETSVKSDAPFKATYNLSIHNEIVSMNVWMNGNANRELFNVKSPHSDAFRNMLPEDIEKAPMLTTVVRQYGEAWNTPFVAVYEPSTTSEPSTVKSVKSFTVHTSTPGFVGLQIESKTDRTDYLFSSDIFDSYTHNDISFTGTFGILTKEPETSTLFIGAGKEMEYAGYGVEILGKKSGSATLVFGKHLQLTCNDAILLTVPDVYKKGDVVLNIGFKQLNGGRTEINGKKVVVFKVPPTNFQEISISTKTK
jgi:hypothetical protein